MAIETMKTETDYKGDAQRTGGDSDGTQKVEQTYEDVKEAVQQRMGDIERQIRDRPLQSALAAAGLGLLLGVLLTR